MDVRKINMLPVPCPHGGNLEFQQLAILAALMAIVHNRIQSGDAFQYSDEFKLTPYDNTQLRKIHSQFKNVFPVLKGLGYLECNLYESPIKSVRLIPDKVNPLFMYDGVVLVMDCWRSLKPEQESIPTASGFFKELKADTSLPFEKLFPDNLLKLMKDNLELRVAFEQYLEARMEHRHKNTTISITQILNKLKKDYIQYNEPERLIEALNAAAGPGWQSVYFNPPKGETGLFKVRKPVSKETAHITYKCTSQQGFLSILAYLSDTDDFSRASSELSESDKYSAATLVNYLRSYHIYALKNSVDYYNVCMAPSSSLGSALGMFDWFMDQLYKLAETDDIRYTMKELNPLFGKTFEELVLSYQEVTGIGLASLCVGDLSKAFSMRSFLQDRSLI